VSLIPGVKELLADKRYDTDAIRASSKSAASRPSFQANPTARRKSATTRKPTNRNIVERCFCRLTDWRRIATRYDKLAQNFFSALCFVETFAYWI
jgi:transposase